MSQKKSGQIIYICKTYTEEAEQIAWNTTKGDIRIAAAQVVLHGHEGVRFGDYTPVQPKRFGTQNIKRGYWTDTHDRPVTEAITGDEVRFHIETTCIPDGELIWFGLYDDDRLVNPAEDGKDDHYPLEHYDTHKGYFTEPVKGNKAVITITLKHLEAAVRADADRQLELYFRVSYRRQNVDLPLDSANYLKVIALPLVIDRYKMPGLNVDGTQIADDMAFGYGAAKTGLIYSSPEIENYKADYKSEGWNIYRQYSFANLEDAPANPLDRQALNEIVVSSRQQPAVHTRINPQIIPPTYEERQQQRIDAENRRNRKARYSRRDIVSHRQWLMNSTADTEEWILRDDFRAMKAAMVWGALSPVLDSMISKFLRKEGGVFEDARLTASIRNNPATHRYCTLIEDHLAEHLKKHHGGLIGLETLSPEFPDAHSHRMSGKKFNTPAFVYGSDGNLIAGRTLALNDIWATEIMLKTYKRDGDLYSGTYQVTLWDHFGIDAPDMDKFFSYGAGFRAWFVLQHLHGCKPFLTKITFEQAFSGNVNIGEAERLQAREAEAQERAAQDRKDEELRRMTRKKPWEY